MTIVIDYIHVTGYTDKTELTPIFGDNSKRKLMTSAEVFVYQQLLLKEV